MVLTKSIIREISSSRKSAASVGRGELGRGTASRKGGVNLVVTPGRVGREEQGDSSGRVRASLALKYRHFDQIRYMVYFKTCP